MLKQDLALNKQQRLIYHKTQPIQTKPTICMLLLIIHFKNFHLFGNIMIKTFPSKKQNKTMILI